MPETDYDSAAINVPGIRRGDVPGMSAAYENQALQKLPVIPEYSTFQPDELFELFGNRPESILIKQLCTIEYGNRPKIEPK